MSFNINHFSQILKCISQLELAQMIGTGVKAGQVANALNPSHPIRYPHRSAAVPARSILSQSQDYDPKKLASMQETVGETSSQSVVVAVDRWLLVFALSIDNMLFHFRPHDHSFARRFFKRWKYIDIEILLKDVFPKEFKWGKLKILCLLGSVQTFHVRNQRRPPDFLLFLMHLVHEKFSFWTGAYKHLYAYTVVSILREVYLILQ
jgi:hypothetical protein